MDSVSKTLYIPLCGKARVSRQGILLHDPMAETIWDQVCFPLKGKANSKWLTYYMAMRAKVFDEWTEEALRTYPDSVVLHIGCGLDSRVLRIGNTARCWYDVDLPAVIARRNAFYSETDFCRMLAADASQTDWIPALADSRHAIVILEGLSMYLQNREVTLLFAALLEKYQGLSILMDVYTPFAARATRYKNPINEVGVTQVFGIGDPESILPPGHLRFSQEHTMAPPHLLAQLSGFDRRFFTWMFSGKLARKFYRLFEYQTP